MNITTNITTVIHIELTETEARLALVDCRELQTQIRLALAPLGAARAVASGRKKRAVVLAAKGKARRAAAPRSTGTKERVPCAICRKLLRPSSVGYHMKHNHPDSASVGTD